MAKILYFRGLQIGDGVVDVAPDTQPQARPVAQVGLYQENAGLVMQGANRVRGVEISVHLKAASPEAFTLAVAAIQELTGLQGELKIVDNGTTVLRGLDWWMTGGGKPNVKPGFGGRFTESWTLRFDGETALTAA